MQPFFLFPSAWCNFSESTESPDLYSDLSLPGRAVLSATLADQEGLYKVFKFHNTSGIFRLWIIKGRVVDLESLFGQRTCSSRQIRVNAVSPGPVHSNFGDGAFDKHPEYIKPLAEQTALGRIAKPEDIAKVIVHLLSDDFAWVTAQDIEISGGFML